MDLPAEMWRWHGSEGWWTAQQTRGEGSIFPCTALPITRFWEEHKGNSRGRFRGPADRCWLVRLLCLDCIWLCAHNLSTFQKGGTFCLWQVPCAVYHRFGVELGLAAALGVRRELQGVWRRFWGELALSCLPCIVWQDRTFCSFGCCWCWAVFWRRCPPPRHCSFCLIPHLARGWGATGVVWNGGTGWEVGADGRRGGMNSYLAAPCRWTPNLGRCPFHQEADGSHPFWTAVTLCY